MLPLHPALITGVGSFRGPSSCRDNCFPSASSPSPSPTPTLSKPNLDRGSCISKREESLGSFFIPSPEFCYPPPPREKGAASARRAWVERGLENRARLGFLRPRSRGRESQKPGREQPQAPGALGVSFPPPTAKLSAEAPPAPPDAWPSFLFRPSPFFSPAFWVPGAALGNSKGSKT